jgi:hypothetical protein
VDSGSLNEIPFKIFIFEMCFFSQMLDVRTLRNDSETVKMERLDYFKGLIKNVPGKFRIRRSFLNCGDVRHWVIR